MRKKVSLVLPCYNVGRYIADCLDSVYYQDIPEDEYEVICVNDCSTDNTRDVILSFGAIHPNLTLIDHMENLTAGGARNTGIKAAKGEYIWFVDPDDAIKPDCLQELYSKAMKTGVDVLFFNYDDADEKLNVLREDRTYSDCVICSGQEFVSRFFPGEFSVFGIVWRAWFRTDFLHQTGVEYPIMRTAEDVVFLWRILLDAEIVCSVSDAYYTYRGNPFSLTKQQTVARIAFADRVLRGAEIVRMMHGRTIIPVIAEDMRRNIQWCACSNLELLPRMSKKERGKYYDEIRQRQDAVEAIRPYMNKKNRILFSPFLGKPGWLLKTDVLCHLEQKGRR